MTNAGFRIRKNINLTFPSIAARDQIQRSRDFFGIKLRLLRNSVIVPWCVLWGTTGDNNQGK